MNATADLLFRPSGQATLHEVDPRGAGRRTGDLETRPPGEPIPNEDGLRRALVVPDQMNSQRFRNVLLKGIENLAKLHAPVSPRALAHDGSGLHSKGRASRRA